MKSQQIIEYGQPLIEREEPTPKPQGSEVLVRVTHCGVCHSDVHIQDGYFDMGGGTKQPVAGMHKLPFTMGHEIEGVVEALGPEAEGQGVKVGDRRLVWPWIGCNDCPYCARGDEAMCLRPQHLGVYLPGGYSDHVLVPHPRYLLEYEGIPEGLAATYMCSGLTAFGALKKIGALPEGEQILIVGAGGLGNMALRFAPAMFGRGALVADINDEALKAAQENGAAATYNSRDKEARKRILSDTNGGVYAAVDFVGSEASLNFALGCLRRGGKAIVVGLFGGSLTIPIPTFPLRGIGIQGSMVATLAETKEMLALVKSGKVAPIPIETRPLAEASRTLDDLRAGRIRGRVVLEPGA